MVLLKKQEQGLSLIKLIILLGVLAVFVSGFMMLFHPLEMLQSMQDQKRKADLETIQKALELYYQKNGIYPSSSENFEIVDKKVSLQWGKDSWVSYLSVLPNDPVPFNRTYVYYANPADGNQSYWVYTSLERITDEPDACNDHCSLGNGQIPVDACGKGNAAILCNFGVSSTNVSP